MHFPSTSSNLFGRRWNGRRCPPYPWPPGPQIFHVHRFRPDTDVAAGVVLHANFGGRATSSASRPMSSNLLLENDPSCSIGEVYSECVHKAFPRMRRNRESSLQNRRSPLRSRSTGGIVAALGVARARILHQHAAILIRRSGSRRSRSTESPRTDLGNFHVSTRSSRMPLLE